MEGFPKTEAPWPLAEGVPKAAACAVELPKGPEEDEDTAEGCAEPGPADPLNVPGIEGLPNVVVTPVCLQTALLPEGFALLDMVPLALQISIRLGC